MTSPRRIVVASLAEAAALEERVRRSAAASCTALGALLETEPPLAVMRAVKFRQVGHDPVDVDRPLNLIEQIHRTFMYLAAIRGVEFLLRRHPGHGPYTLHFGTGQGPDIISMDEQVAAERGRSSASSFRSWRIRPVPAR